MLDSGQETSRPSLDDWLPAEHLARLIAELVDVHVDLVPIRAAYHAGRAAPRDDPRLMVRILLYAYTTGVCSSRVIERKCVDDVPFRWLADGRRRTIGRSPDFVSATRLRSGTCSWKRWRCARRRAWCGWDGSCWTGRGCETARRHAR